SAICPFCAIWTPYPRPAPAGCPLRPAPGVPRPDGRAPPGCAGAPAVGRGAGPAGRRRGVGGVRLTRCGVAVDVPVPACGPRARARALGLDLVVSLVVLVVRFASSSRRSCSARRVRSRARARRRVALIAASDVCVACALSPCRCAARAPVRQCVRRQAARLAGAGRVEVRTCCALSSMLVVVRLVVACHPALHLLLAWPAPCGRAFAPPGGGWRVRAERGVRAGVRPCPYPTPMPPAGGDREGEGGGATRVPPGTSPPPARG